MTFDVTGWRAMTPGEGLSEAFALAVMAAENPVLDGIGGVPREGWHGLWLTRPTAWVHIVEAPKVGEIAATVESATKQAKAMAVNDPRRIGDASFKPNVTLVAGPETSDAVNAGHVWWTTTKTGRDRIDREVQATIYLIEAPGPPLWVEAVTLAGGQTTQADILDLVRTIWAPRPSGVCYSLALKCPPEPVVPAPRDRMLP